MNHLCVIGFPSKVGGADTELDHQIHCWQALGLQVHLIHTAPLDANLQAMRMEDRGCVIHEPRDWQAAEDDAASAAGDLCLMAGTWYGGTIRFYRDNTLKNIVTITNADITGANDNANSWSAGAQEQDGSSTAVAAASDLAEILIFNRALGESDLVKLFHWASSLYEGNPSSSSSSSPPPSSSSSHHPSSSSSQHSSSHHPSSSHSSSHQPSSSSHHPSSSSSHHSSSHHSSSHSGSTSSSSSSGAGMRLWLRADEGLYQDTGGSVPAVATGDPVALWRDQSGQANDVTQPLSGQQPLLQLSQLNGQPAVRFDGVDDLLVVADNAGLRFSTITAMAVVRVLGDGTGTAAFVTKNGNTSADAASYQYAALRYGGHDVTLSLYIGGWGDNDSQTGINDGAFYYLLARYDGTTVQHELNGQPDGQTSPGGPLATTTGSLQVGGYNASFASAAYLYGDLAELRLWDRSLSDGEIATLNSYVLGAYGLGSGGGSSSSQPSSSQHSSSQHSSSHHSSSSHSSSHHSSSSSSSTSSTSTSSQSTSSGSGEPSSSTSGAPSSSSSNPCDKCKIVWADGTEITTGDDGNNRVLPGQNIRLTVTCDRETEIQAINWNIGGSTFKSYTVTQDAGTLDTNVDLSADPLEFYWADAGELTVGATVTLADEDQPCDQISATFNVIDPRDGVSFPVGNDPPIYGQAEAIPPGEPTARIQFGNLPNEPNNEGIYFRASVATPPGFGPDDGFGPSYWLFAQLVLEATTTMDSNAPPTCSSHNTKGPYDLDGFPYSINSFPGTPPFTAGAGEFQVSDSPAIEIDGHFQINDYRSYQMYLMFLPPTTKYGSANGSAWVVLKRVDWWFEYCAAGVRGDVWAVSDRDQFATPWFDHVIHPQWTSYWKPLTDAPAGCLPACSGNPSSSSSTSPTSTDVGHGFQR